MSKKKLIIFFTGVFFWAFAATAVHAGLTYGDAGGALSVVADRTGVQKVDIQTASGRIIKGFLGLVGLLFFILIVYAGFKWMIAKGDEEVVNKARDTIFGAVIGLSIVTASYAITNFISDRFINGQGGFSPVETGGTIGDEALGCCIKWSSGSYLEEGGTASGIITTKQDCQIQGEKQGSSDEADGGICVGPKEKCWLFSANLTQCEEQADAYN